LIAEESMKNDDDDFWHFLACFTCENERKMAVNAAWV